MKTNVKIIIAVAAGFIAGCAAGMFLPGLETSANSGKGDIAKVSKFNRSVVGGGVSAVEEELKNSPEQLAKTKATLDILTSRMAEFDELVDIAVAAGEGNEDIASSLNDLKKVQRLAQNARLSGEQASSALEAVCNGEKSDIDYEQASQNLTVAFLLVDRQVSVGKQFVCEVDSYLKNKNIDENLDLAFARDLWANYCCVEAAINDDKSELAFWGKQSNLVNDVKGALAGLPTEAMEVVSKGLVISNQFDITSNVGKVIIKNGEDIFTGIEGLKAGAGLDVVTSGKGGLAAGAGSEIVTVGKKGLAAGAGSEIVTVGKKGLNSVSELTEQIGKLGSGPDLTTQRTGGRY